MPHPESPGGLEGRTRRILALRAWGPARLRSAAARWAVNVLALAGAALIIISAIIHRHLWDQGYSGIAVMGPLFLAQGVISIPSVVVLGVFRRLGLLAAGAALMAGAVGLLLTSVQVGLFGLRTAWPRRTLECHWSWSSPPRACWPPARCSSPPPGRTRPPGDAPPEVKLVRQQSRRAPCTYIRMCKAWASHSSGCPGRWSQVPVPVTPGPRSRPCAVSSGRPAGPGRP